MPEIILSAKDRQALKARAHGLKPVVLLGAAGLTDAVAREIDRALLAHELVKVKVPGDDRSERQALFAAIADRLSAAPVQMIGKLLVFYRPAPDEPPGGYAPEERSPKAPARAIAAAPQRASARSTPTRNDVQKTAPRSAPRRDTGAMRRAAGKGVGRGGKR